MITKLTLSSAIRLASGYPMPRLGFGVYRCYDTKTSVLEALKAGYRLIDIVHWFKKIGISSLNRHVDSAQAYRNEAEVAEAIRASGVPREEVFVSACSVEVIYYPVFVLISCSSYSH